MDKAKLGLNPALFKKLNNNIWEFRTKYNGIEYRLLAFWDKRDNARTLVVSTHGIVKKTDKIPKLDNEKATKIMLDYLKE